MLCLHVCWIRLAGKVSQPEGAPTPPLPPQGGGVAIPPSPSAIPLPSPQQQLPHAQMPVDWDTLANKLINPTEGTEEQLVRQFME